MFGLKNKTDDESLLNVLVIMAANELIRCQKAGSRFDSNKTYFDTKRFLDNQNIKANKYQEGTIRLASAKLSENVAGVQQVARGISSGRSDEVAEGIISACDALEGVGITYDLSRLKKIVNQG